MNKDEIEVMFSANEYLIKLLPGLKRLREEIRNRDLTNLDDLVDGIEGIAWLMEAFSTVNDCGVQADADSINEHLETLNDAIQSEDYTLMADIIEYELEPIAAGWLEELENLLRGGGYVN